MEIWQKKAAIAVFFSFKFVHASSLLAPHHCVIPFSPTYCARIDVRGETAPECGRILQKSGKFRPDKKMKRHCNYGVSYTDRCIEVLAFIWKVTAKVQLWILTLCKCVSVYRDTPLNMTFKF